MAVRLNGSAHASLGSFPNGVARCSFACWVKFNTLPAYGVIDSISLIRENGESEQYGTTDKSMFVMSDGTVKGYAYDGGTKKAASTTLVSTGVWYHIGFSADGSNLRVWVNGVNEGTAACGDTYTGYSNAVWTVAGIPAGWGEGESSRTRMDGWQAECAWWTGIALDAGEWAALARGFSPLLVRPASLLRYSPFVRTAQDAKVSTAWSLTSTSFEAHPRVIYPRRKQVVVASAAAPSTTVARLVNKGLVGSGLVGRGRLVG